MQGSMHLYDTSKRGLCASINFITCHDGFTMMDLFSYNAKINQENGEDNKDGSNENYSWDCKDPSLRKKMIKNAMSILLLSHGVPMLLAGDEFGNSQNGNNNAYCQDNEISWLDWNDLKRNKDIFEYVSKLIALRKSHECLRSPAESYSNSKNGYPPVSCHGIEPWKPEFWGNMLGMLFCGDDDFVYIAINMHWESGVFRLPDLPPEFKWSMYLASEDGAAYNGGNSIQVAPHSVAIMAS
jgi:glycogen operon protein